tara:strand:- start:5427 stop:5591 length:165 start_codon:yes stop_codon:yes gene_type:complete
MNVVARIRRRLLAATGSKDWWLFARRAGRAVDTECRANGAGQLTVIRHRSIPKI